jgi:hypothetical protein
MDTNPIDPQTAFDIVHGLRIENNKKDKALEIAEQAIQGILDTQMHELESAKSEIITLKTDLQNAKSDLQKLSQPTEETVVEPLL